MKLWRSVVGKLWMTIIGLVLLVLAILGMFLLEYIDETFANSADVKRLFIITGAIGFSLTTFFAFFLSTKITQPLIQLKKAADRFSQGDYSTRVRYTTSDEIGELAGAFNLMMSQLEGTIHDLSHQKEQLGSILRSMNDAVITFDANGSVLLSNPQGEKLINVWEPNDSTSAGQMKIPQPLRELFLSVVAETREMNQRIYVRNHVYSVIMTPLYDNTSVRGAVAVLRDITEEDRLEKLRKDFVANVSHELRTPLSMMQGYSEALLDDIAGSPEEQKELVKVIHDESLRMGRLVHNLLDLARLETGRFEMNFVELDLRELSQRVIRKFSALCQQHEVKLQYELSEPDTPYIIHSGDPDRLEQVWTNLLDNALRHTPKGHAITLRLLKGKNDNGEAIVIAEIEDEGAGIPPEDVPYIFERFYKADKARTRNGSSGTGLGLAIVNNLIKAHHGKIEVFSELGKGTTFRIQLPVQTK